MVLAIGQIGRAIELTLVNDKNWVVSRQNIRIHNQAKTFAPGNLRAVVDN